MNIDGKLIANALAALSANERSCIFSSTSVGDARTAVTKFSVHLATAAAVQISAALTIRCTFKGNKGGRGSTAAGGMEPLKKFAETTIAGAHLTYDPEEFLLDFWGFKEDVFHTELTAESEARPSAKKGMDTRDLDKLLLVRSPRRLYVGRVNVPKKGNEEKLLLTKKTIRDRFVMARNSGLLAEGDTFDVVLLQTTVLQSEIFHVATWSTTTTNFDFAVGTT